LFETVHLECHQQLSFTVKMTEIVGGWRFAPDPTVRAYMYSAFQTPSWIKGATSKGGEKEGRVREANRRKGKVTRGGEGLWTLTMLETY